MFEAAILAYKQKVRIFEMPHLYKIPHLARFSHVSAVLNGKFFNFLSYPEINKAGG